MVKFETDKLSFSQIMLGHIKKILELSSQQLRETETTIIQGTWVQHTSFEDTRYSYVQAVENFSYILSPYFDEDTTKVFDECIKIINAHDYEVKVFVKEEYDKVVKESPEPNKKEKFEDEFIIKMKVKYAKILFIRLNQLLKDNKYLATQFYTDPGETGKETEDEVVEDD